MTNSLTNTVINTTNANVNITGLTPSQYYNINITAVNIIGSGPVLMINKITINNEFVILHSYRLVKFLIVTIPLIIISSSSGQ